MSVAWVGLADLKYWEYIAKYCVPSWTILPGDKYIITDDATFKLDDNFKVVQFETVENKQSKFLARNEGSRKVHNFWRKMQSQTWATKNLVQYDFVVLIDTDIECINFNNDEFKIITDQLVSQNILWATGQSQRRGHDSGFIVINMKHNHRLQAFLEYENIWDSGKISTLNKAYDGDAMESMLEVYPSLKIRNTDYGSGLHIYDIGFVHWGSKKPKVDRAAAVSGKELVKQRIAEIIPKVFKNS